MKRREFLKTSALAVGASSLSAADFISGPVPNQKIAGINASHFGVYKTEVTGGQLTNITPFTEDEFVSPLIHAMPDRVYAPTRIKYPYIREGYLKDGRNSDTTKRGADKFVRVSWDKALDLIADELKYNYKEFGYTSVFGGSHGWDCSGKLNSPSTLLQRALTLAGGYTGISGDYSAGAGQVIMPYLIGSIDVYQKQTTYKSLIENTKNMVFWSIDPIMHLQVHWTSATHEFYKYAKQWKNEAKERGVKFYSVDPARNDTASYFNSQLISPRPNTDVAMILGMCHTLYTNDMYDKNFIKKYTVGFDKFIDYVLGKTDGVEKTAAWAEKICGVNADAIANFAKTLFSDRTFIMGGFAAQRADHGEQFLWAIVTLSAMIGHIGLPGGGFGFGYHEGSGGSPKHQTPGLTGISSTILADGEWKNREQINIPVARISDMLENPGATIDFNGKKITYPDVKMILWAGGNPFHHHQDRNKMLKAWQKAKTVVVSEIYWNATARQADIVLPACTEVERNDIEMHGDYSNIGFVAMKKVVEPVGESKSDFDMFRELAKRFGKEELYMEGRKDEMEWIEYFYNLAKKQAEDSKLSVKMPEFKEFWSNGYVRFPDPTEADKNWVKLADFRANPIRNRLGTKSGKIEIFSETIDKMGYDDCKGHVMWFEPTEWLGSDKAEKYPLHFLSPHPKYRLHSQLNNTWLRNLYEVQEREPIWINSQDAKKRGIETGDVVRVFNDRGTLLAGAMVTDMLMPGVVRMYEGAWFDPLEPGKIGSMCKHGDVNTLTLDKGTSKLAQATSANTALVQIEKFNGELPKVTVFSEPSLT